ncbi:nucleoporin NDC1 [Ceratobasidium sp. AG-Ba]|nr:nucleoporin NDC1 [Ceratobasidium sp. AG-Ba]
MHFILRSGGYWQLVSWFLFWRAFVLHLSTLLLWDIAGAWFEINASQVIHLSQFKEDPNASLIAGLQSKDDYFKKFTRASQYFAFAELANVTTNRPPRRIALFSDLKANPTAWELVCRECFLLLGKDYSTVINRNAPSPAVVPPVAVQPAAAQASKISKDPIYKSAPAASSGALDKFVGTANAVANVVPTTVPSIFLSSHATPAASIPVQLPASIKSWKLPRPDLSGIMSMLPQSVVFWSRWLWDMLFVERQEAKLEALLPNRAADIWAIEALSTLVAHSLHEDPYGRVQRDIPRVLEALISYLGALEQLVEETNANPTPNTEDAIKKVVQPVAEALREGIRMIVLEFGPRLTAFEFPPRIARRLQTMVDYL